LRRRMRRAGGRHVESFAQSLDLEVKLKREREAREVDRDTES
jgi:hypothetical protein